MDSRFRGNDSDLQCLMQKKGGIIQTFFSTFLFAIFGLGMILNSTNIFAQGGPPMITDDPGTPGAGHWENNFAFTLDNTPTEHLYETPIADINYGWGERVQLKIEIPWLVVKAPNSSAKTGLGNIDPGVKIRFLDEDSSGINLSTYPQYRLNYTTISSTLVGNQFFLPVEASRSFGSLDLDMDFGYDFFINPPSGQWQYGMVAGYNFSSAFELMAELHAYSATGMTTELLTNIGCRAKITDNLFFIGSAGRNLTPAGYNEYIAYGGVQLLIE
jgi:hypothetical protein